ncbi:MAG: beta-eliminating lyase-related protein [Paracoccus sp. (in: a-proteobacteria)]|nr:beta-eliminating lyase-related protein [Paracoccus sp. (in: a-proteobacteria)]
MNFASDNCAGVHPSVMAALGAANEGAVSSYGADGLTRAAADRLRDVLGAPEAEVMFVATGTAANAVALGAVCPGWGRIFAHRDAHIQTSECGAPEMFTAGAKMSLLDGEGGMFSPDALDEAAQYAEAAGLNAGRNAAVSITNATEWGRVYGPADVAAIAEVTHRRGMALHMDGARFANAVAASGASPADLTSRAGVDLLVFGGTKNGAMGVEALVAFNPGHAEALRFMRKRSGHLLSKHRYLAAQIYALLQGDLWLDLARHANAMAARLGEVVADMAGASLLAPVETNQVFVALPEATAQRLRAAGAVFHDWPKSGAQEPGQTAIRLVTGWATDPAEIDAFAAAMGKN